MKTFQELREKTLTPAEKKKREEIAKAMEKDDPGMDMSKKMAIATAQAKKVAEEVELEEATTAQIQKVLGPTKNAQQGIAALKKAFNVDDKKAKAMLDKAMKEDSQLDELSVKTLSSYAAKASDARGHRGMSTKKVDNRYAGVAKAGKRMDKQMEDAEQVDELNKDTLRSYAGKALKTAKGKKIGQRMTGRAGALDRLSGWHAAKMKNPTPTQSKVARPYKAK